MSEFEEVLLNMLRPVLDAWERAADAVRNAANQQEVYWQHKTYLDDDASRRS